MADRKEYIERGAVLKVLKENIEEMEGDIYYGSHLGVPEDEIDGLISTIQAADVVKVVRCRDCKHWTRDGNGYCDDESYCNNPDGLDNYAKPDDYCSYGERKDGDDNAAD